MSDRRGSRVHNALGIPPPYFSAASKAVAQIQQGVLQGSIMHVIDGDAEVADKAFQLEGVHGDDFDLATLFPSRERVLDAFDGIAISEEE